ncbi:hypothetical protein F2Q70_00016697 [Brassica cretica]|uniref:Uncharacterized protein n=1 Tax=Brassica cretica TaxID=69181 RepID=A0A8S9I0T7_BRACR|nr:hypothetical protein F2Q70_00016697 [Brassica cretica]
MHTARSQRSERARTRLGRYIATELKPSSVATPQKGPPLRSLLNPHRNASRFVSIGVSVDILRRKQRPSTSTARSLHSDQARAELVRYVTTEHASRSVATKRPSLATELSDRAQAKFGRYVATELEPKRPSTCTFRSLQSDRAFPKR